MHTCLHLISKIFSINSLVSLPCNRIRCITFNLFPDVLNIWMSDGYENDVEVCVFYKRLWFPCINFLDKALYSLNSQSGLACCSFAERLPLNCSRSLKVICQTSLLLSRPPLAHRLFFLRCLFSCATFFLAPTFFLAAFFSCAAFFSYAPPFFLVRRLFFLRAAFFLVRHLFLLVAKLN